MGRTPPLCGQDARVRPEGLVPACGAGMGPSRDPSPRGGAIESLPLLVPVPVPVPAPISVPVPVPLPWAAQQGQEAVASQPAALGTGAGRLQGQQRFGDTEGVGTGTPQGIGTHRGTQPFGAGLWAGTGAQMWGLGVLIPLLAAGAVRVSQAPGELRVPAGAEVTLRCRVLAAEPWDLLRVEWVKDGARGALCASRLRPGNSTAPAPCAPRLRTAWDPPSATLSLRSAQGDDAGRYRCRVTVEIPRYSTATGNGTRLRVTADTRIYVNVVPRAPKKLLLPPKEMDNCMHQARQHRAWGTPTAPQP
ncbi:transmembrane and immunoglobulin domain-containing protein 2 [Ara ararauna]